MKQETQTVKKIPKWIENRYLYLLGRFKEEEFNFDQAKNALKEKYEDSEAQTKRVLSELQKAACLKSERTLEDKRAKVYTLINILEAPLENANKVDTRSRLNSILKNTADIIRTRVDYTFILLLLFYKAISDRWEREFKKKHQLLLKDGWKEIKLDKIHPILCNKNSFYL